MPRRSNRKAGLPFTAEGPITLENRGFRLQVRLRGKSVEIHLTEKATGRELSGKPYLYRASVPHEAGVLTCDRLLDPRINSPQINPPERTKKTSLRISGTLAGLSVEHILELPADRSFMEERILLSNETAETVSLLDLELGFLRTVTDERFQVCAELKEDRLVALPLRHRATDPSDFDRDFAIQDFLDAMGKEHYPLDPFPVNEMPSLHRYSEGWAWGHDEHSLGIFKYNQEGMEFSVLSPVASPRGLFLRFGGAVMVAGDPVILKSIEPGMKVKLGKTRFVTMSGDYRAAACAFRDFLDEQGCRLPSDFDPPVHWNELYDTPEWNLSRPAGSPPSRPAVSEAARSKPDQPEPGLSEAEEGSSPAWKSVKTRHVTYAREIILQEAEKARAFGCQALYLDPGWDTVFGSLIWGEEWLGPRKDFVELLRKDYGLAVSLHCPLAPWMSVDGRGVDTWSIESFRKSGDGKRIDGSVCLGSRQYLEEAELRLLEHCADGVRFLMFDGIWWIGGCWDPKHGHEIPYTTETHCRASLSLAQKIHEKYPDVIIEMHDFITGGSTNRYCPVYYKYGLPGSFDENWGFELMWSCMEDIKSERARSLFYYRLGCNVPVYLHIDLRDDNEHCLVLWWFASTCQHLGIGGTHHDPRIVEAQKAAMHRYRRLERFYKRGDFHTASECRGDTRPEEIHLHVLPEEDAIAVNLFNLSDVSRRISGTVPCATLGIDPAGIYHGSKGCAFNPENGSLQVDRELEPWAAYIGEIMRIL